MKHILSICIIAILFIPLAWAPVQLSEFNIERQEENVIIKWDIELDNDGVGFNVLRSESENGKFEQINDELIKEFEFTDTTAKPNIEYFYRIEIVSDSGEKEQALPVELLSKEKKIITSWGALKRRK